MESPCRLTAVYNSHLTVRQVQEEYRLKGTLQGGLIMKRPFQSQQQVSSQSNGANGNGKARASAVASSKLNPKAGTEKSVKPKGEFIDLGSISRGSDAVYVRVVEGQKGGESYSMGFRLSQQEALYISFLLQKGAELLLSFSLAPTSTPEQQGETGQKVRSLISFLCYN